MMIRVLTIIMAIFSICFAIFLDMTSAALALCAALALWNLDTQLDLYEFKKQYYKDMDRLL